MSRSWHFLEVGLDPDLVERDHRHQRRARRARAGRAARCAGPPGRPPAPAARCAAAPGRPRARAAAARCTLGCCSTLMPSVSAWLRGELLARRGQRRLRRGERALGRGQLRLGVIELFLADRAGGDQRLAPRHVVLRARHVRSACAPARPRAARSAPAACRCWRTACAPRARSAPAAPRPARARPGRRPGRACTSGWPALTKSVSSAQMATHGAADLRRDLHHVALHVGVVGGLVVAQHQRPVGAVGDAGRRRPRRPPRCSAVLRAGLPRGGGSGFGGDDGAPGLSFGAVREVARRGSACRRWTCCAQCGVGVDSRRRGRAPARPAGQSARAFRSAASGAASSTLVSALQHREVGAQAGAVALHREVVGRLGGGLRVGLLAPAGARSSAARRSGRPLRAPRRRRRRCSVSTAASTSARLAAQVGAQAAGVEDRQAQRRADAVLLAARLRAAGPGRCSTARRRPSG